MKEFLYHASNFLIFVPGLLIAYMPMKHHLRICPRRLILNMILLSLLLCFTCGGLCYFLPVKTLWLFFPAAITGIFYIHTLDVTRWKSVSVFLAVCGNFSCLGCIANAAGIYLSLGNTPPALSLNTTLFYNLMCWGTVVIIWYPATHAARYLLEEDAFAQTWYVFWILPVIFIGLNLFLYPLPTLLSQKRLIRMYIIICLILLFLLLLFYSMFYLMATSLNRNDRLRQENQFLFMQQARYNSLCTAIAETRQARHDMRHHFSALQGLAAHQEWKKLTDYLSEAAARIPDTELNLCDNTAADAVAAHYGLLFHNHNIPVSFELDLPVRLPVPEIDLCLTLSNLLENALEASLKMNPAKRQIRVQAYLPFNHIILITVENAYDGTIKEKNGIFQSSKRRGAGIGIQSVRHIAEKNGGYSRFFYENGIFYANVMLRAET